MDNCLSCVDWGYGVGVKFWMGGVEMNFKDYQVLTGRTMPKMIIGKNNRYYDDRAFVNYCLGLAGETGEFIDLVKKEKFHGHPPDDDKKMKELGDILHYLTGLCTMYGYSLEEVATLNILKLKERYPNGFSHEASRNRKEDK